MLGIHATINLMMAMRPDLHCKLAAVFSVHSCLSFLLIVLIYTVNRHKKHLRYLFDFWYDYISGTENHFLHPNRNHSHLHYRYFIMTTLTTVTTKKELAAQKRSCVAVIKAFNTAEGKKEDARNKLFDIFSGYLTGKEDQAKQAKLAIKIFCAHNGHANVKELCEGTGLNLRAEFSMISTVAGLLVDCESFTDVRRAYDAERANKSKKKAKDTKAKANKSESQATESEESESLANIPQVTGLLLEAINKASQLDADLQNILALEMIEVIEKAQADLKIKKAA